MADRRQAGVACSSLHETSQHETSLHETSQTDEFSHRLCRSMTFALRRHEDAVKCDIKTPSIFHAELMQNCAVT